MRITAEQAKRLQKLRNSSRQAPHPSATSASMPQAVTRMSPGSIRSRPFPDPVQTPGIHRQRPATARPRSTPRRLARGVQPAELAFTIEGAAVPKERARVVTNHGKRRAYTPKRTKTYADQVTGAGRCAMEGYVPMSGPVEATIQFVIAVPRSWPKWKREAALAGAIAPTERPDVDNLAKNVLDALNKIAFYDDSQITRKILTKEYGETAVTAVRLRRLGQLPHSVKRRDYLAYLRLRSAA